VIIVADSPPNKPLKLSAAGFSCASEVLDIILVATRAAAA